MVIFNKVCTQLVLEKRFNYILIYNYIHSIAYTDFALHKIMIESDDRGHSAEILVK